MRTVEEAEHARKQRPIFDRRSQHLPPGSAYFFAGSAAKEKTARYAKQLLVKKAAEAAKLRELQKNKLVAQSTMESQSEIRPAPKKSCTRCGKLLTALAMEIHVGGCGKPPASSPEDFPFEILREGLSNNLRAEIKKYILYKQSFSQRPSGYDWDWSRLDEVELMSPHVTHFGRKGWFGYFVLEFSNSARVVLESPLRNDATYVVGANWKDLISLTKPEVRLGDYQRYYHVGHYWRRRVERALQRS